MGDLSNNFSAWEFACKCGCGEGKIDMALVSKLQGMRDALKDTIKINSGIRCEKYNAEIGGNPESEHIPDRYDGISRAADIGYSGSWKRRKLIILSHTFFRRVGIDDDFIHVGNSPRKPQDRTWLYKKKKGAL